METFNYEELTCHNAAILEEIPGMVCNVSGRLNSAAIALFYCIV